jgi:hypothetical protein
LHDRGPIVGIRATKKIIEGIIDFVRGKHFFPLRCALLNFTVKRLVQIIGIIYGVVGVLIDIWAWIRSENHWAAFVLLMFC